MPAWLLPTVRATPWGPLVGVTAALAVTATLSTYGGRWSPGLVGIAAAALAAALVAGLHDPAAALLSAVPTSAAVRRARRLMLLLPAGLATWLAYEWAGQRLDPAAGWSLGALAALTATGLAVAVWAAPGTGTGIAAGVAAPMIWLGATRAGGSTDGVAAEVLFAWQHHAWAVTAAAGVAFCLGRNR